MIDINVRFFEGRYYLEAWENAPDKGDIVRIWHNGEALAIGEVKNRIDTDG